MNIVTKFNLGDSIYAIHQASVYRDHDCTVCEMRKTVVVSGETFPCPKCQGKGRVRVEVYGAWLPDAVGAVANVGIQWAEFSASFDHDDDRDTAGHLMKVTYMTGRSGTMHNERNCFASHELAQAECDARNKAKGFFQGGVP